MNLSIQKVSVAYAVLAVLLIVAGAFVLPHPTHAQELGYADTFGTNLGYADTFDLGYADTFGTNLGYADTYGSNLGYADTFDLGYADTFGSNLGYADTYGSNLGYADTYGSNLGYADAYGSNLGYADTYGSNLGYADTYGSYSYSTPYYSYPSYSNYSSYPTKYSSYASTPSYSSSPTRVVNPVYTSTPTVTTPHYTTTTNTTTNNTCTNNSCNTTNIDNSINGSFNTDNSINNSFNGNTTIATIAQVVPVAQTPVQYPVQYTYPQQNLSCTITASPSSIVNGQSTTLSWSTYGSVYGATTAWLSDSLGNVAPNGSLTVRPTVSKNYTLTVSGYGGTQTCTTYVSVTGTYYTPPVQSYPYVSLTQIPYTGFDLGTYGNALYWAGLFSFALAAAYLVVYYKGGVGMFLGSILGVRSRKSASVNNSGSQLAAPAMFSNGKSEGKPRAPITARASSIEHLPVEPRHSSHDDHAQTLGTPKDSMKVVHSAHGEAPRIIITRA